MEIPQKIQDAFSHVSKILACFIPTTYYQSSYFTYDFLENMEISVDQMYQIENKGHEMGLSLIHI